MSFASSHAFQKSLALLSDTEQLKTDGIAAFKLADFQRAADLFERALVPLTRCGRDCVLPQHAVEQQTNLKLALHLNASQCFLKLAQHDKAAKCASRALAIDAKNIKALLRSATAREAMCQLESALDDLNRAGSSDGPFVRLRARIDARIARGDGDRKATFARMFTS